MATSYRLQIITQEGVQFDRPVYSLRAPGVEGYFGVRPGHAPLIAALVRGDLIITLPDRQQVTFVVSGGVLEVTGQGVTVLADDLATEPTVVPTPH
ncbi:MAG: ATP synthase F1 subunit epsilon [Acidobacteriota bacterium]|jgi:F-type H+-transporting ATPase subunit epsilon|nr:ATP synthase F1 subunit epsilon [Acidobacteriota bacterium]